MLKRGIGMKDQLKVICIQDGDWPTPDEMNMTHDRVLRIFSSEISTDTRSLIIYIRYGCTHHKMSNIPNGRFLCAEMTCPHYVGKAKYEGKYD